MPDPGPKYPEHIQAAVDLLRRSDITLEDKQRVGDQLHAMGYDFNIAAEPARFPSNMSEKGRAPLPEEPAHFPTPEEEKPRPSYVYESQGPPLPSRMDPSGLTPRVREDLPDSYTPEEYSAKGALSAIMPDYVYEPRREPGEPGDVYRKRADQSWRDQAQSAYEEGRAVKRQKSTDGLEHSLTTGMAYLAPIAVGAERGYAMGAPGEVLRGEAMQNLEDMAAGKTDLPGMQELTGGTELLTALMPSSWTSRLMGRAAAGGVRTGSKVLDMAGRAATAAAGAGVDSLARSGIHAAGKALAGEEQDQGAQDVIDQAEESALLGMFLEPVMRGAQRLGLSRVNSLRAAPGSGHALGLIEKAGGKTVADLRNISGLEPPAEIQRARDLQAQPAVTDPAQIARNPALSRRGMAAQDISVERATDALQGNLDRYRRNVPREIAARDQPYLQSDEGQARISVEPAIQRLQERINTGRGDDGLPLPGEEIAASQRLLGQLMRGEFEAPGGGDSGAYTVEEARAMGLPFDEAPINELASDNVGQQPLLMNPQVTTGVANGARNVRIVEHPPDAEYATPDELMGQGREMNLEPLVNREQRRLERAGSVSAEPREMSAEQLERAIHNYEDRIKFANKRQESTIGDRAMLRELIRLRSQFEANEHAPPERGGWAGLRAQDARQMADLEAVLQSARLPRDLNEINFNDPAQRQALDSLVRVYASEGGPNLNRIPAWREFLAQRPGLAHLLDTAAAHREVDALQGRVENSARVGVSGAGAHPYITNAAGFWKSRAYQLDPMMQDLAGVTRGGRTPPPDAADFPDGIGRSEKRAGQAAGPIKRYQQVKAKQKDDDAEKRRARRRLSP